MTWLPSPSAQYMSSGAPGTTWPVVAVSLPTPSRLVAASGLVEMRPGRLSHHRYP